MVCNRHLLIHSTSIYSRHNSRYWGYSRKQKRQGLYSLEVQSRFFFFIINSYSIYLFIYLFIFSCVGSSFRARAFSSCGKRGPLFIVVRGPLFIAVSGPLTITAPPIAGHRLQTRRLSSCGSQAQLLHGMWDLPRPGLEPVSPALAGRFSTTAPPGKPFQSFFRNVVILGTQYSSGYQIFRLPRYTF